MVSFKRFSSEAFPNLALLLRGHARWYAVIMFVALLSFGGWHFFTAAPAGFSPGNVVIAQGASAAKVAQELAEAHVIAHPALLRALLRVSGEENSVQAGMYGFDTPENLFVVLRRIVTGDYGLPPVRLTFVEGATVRDMAARIAYAFPDISEADFRRVAQPYEGYLFPDTYFLPPSSDAASIVALMRANFAAKTAALSPEIAASGHTLSDIVIMASLVEKEARAPTDKRVVAGILWNRILRGMPLQVDAVFGYIYNRDTYSPSLTDLKTDSPYNTYLHTGLPPGPIDNPGLDSLEAAADPAKTDYLYYLTGADGRMHYATTYAGHQANLKRYL